MDLVLKTKVKGYFNERVRLSNADNELKRLLLERPHDYPKVEKFLNNMCEQVVKADELLRTRGLHVKAKTIQDTVYDMTDFFLNLIETENKRRTESALDKAAREALAENIRQADDFLAGGKDNQYSELGLVNEGEAKVKTFKDEKQNH